MLALALHAYSIKSNIFLFFSQATTEKKWWFYLVDCPTQLTFYLDLCWIRLARNMKFRAREIHVTHCVALSSSLAPHFKDEIASLRKRPFFAGF